MNVTRPVTVGDQHVTSDRPAAGVIISFNRREGTLRGYSAGIVSSEPALPGRYASRLSLLKYLFDREAICRKVDKQISRKRDDHTTENHRTAAPVVCWGASGV
jgi:hypothetical protein